VFANERPTIIDCGANIGLSALYFSLKYGADVLAFEADPAIYQCLIENTKHTDHTQGKISTVNKAIWINDEGVDFDIEGGFSGQIRQHGHSLVKSTQRVPSVSLRETLSGFSHVDLLKIDIEGAENQVILDCEGILSVADYIFIEWHSITSNPQLLGEILNVLKKEGFRYHIKEAFTSRSPFVLVEEMCGMDLQLNIFALKAIC
jgi:FkbM family methyltransferase